MLEAALACGRRGWRVFPVHTTLDGLCSCHNSECQNPGKHPKIKDNLNTASSDEHKIKDWWTQWPHANIAFATGAESGIIVLDVDPRNGGDDSLLEIEARHGRLSETLTSWTGGGGRHFYFKYPGFRVNSVPSLKNGVDLKSDGGYVIVPPSRHVSGYRYRWANPSCVICEAPAWLVEILKEPTSGFREESHELLKYRNPLAGVPEGRRDDAIFTNPSKMIWTLDGSINAFRMLEKLFDQPR